MKTIIISLPYSTERRAHMENQLTKAGITDYEFFDAIDGTDTGTTAACMASHKAVWQKIAKANDEPVIVVEDDVVLHGSFYQFAHERTEAVKPFADVALLGYQLNKNPLWDTSIKHWRKPQKTEVNLSFHGAYGYEVMGKQAAEKLLTLSKEVSEHPDLFFRDVANSKQLELYFMVHPIVQHGGFPSTIAHGTPKAAHKPAPEKPAKAPAPKPVNSRKPILRLFINYYESDRQERNSELLRALFTNSQSGLFDEIVNLSDTPAPIEGCRMIHFKTEPQYKDFFAAIAKIARPGDVSVIANLDIYFDETILHTLEMPDGDAYALTRYDIQGGKPVFFNSSSNGADSQDTWIIKGKPKAVKEANFTMGVPGCDNRIAFLLQQAGYNVRNPSLTIKTYHLHQTNYRRQVDGGGNRTMEAVKGKYLLIKGEKL